MDKNALIAVGLPCKWVDGNEAGFSRGLTAQEWDLFCYLRDNDTPEKQRRALGELARRMMDTKVKERDYQYGIDNACTYALSSNQAWKSDGEAMTAWRDAVYAKVYEIDAACQAGERSIPLPDEFLAELPTLEWPAG